MPEVLVNAEMLAAKIPAWKKIGVKHHHGIVIPLFSLKSHNSCGIGEYTDLIPIAQWCKKIGFDVIQLLPLNDIGHDQSPYSALSAYALNPMNLGLSFLPSAKTVPELNELLNSMHELNNYQKIQYKQVFEAKEKFLHLYFRHFSPTFTQTDEYHQFVQENTWVESYALFKTLKLLRQWESWDEWPANIHDLTPSTKQKLMKEHESQIAYHIFVQFLCFKQMRQVKSYCESLEIYLMGDIPILLNLESADVWVNPYIFNTKFSAGAPPDMFSRDGQNWGFPLYDWEQIEKRQFEWWKRRLQIAEQFYDIYRIDHIVGFFRIWAILPNKKGSEGFYIPKDEHEWMSQGRKIMEVMINSSSMLPIGEDLGVIPNQVRQCLKDLGICGTKVIRWEKNWEQNRSFVPYDQYIPESLTTVSTHDCETLQQWWKYLPDEARAFADFKGWNYEENLSADYHLQILKDSHHTNSLFHINPLSEYLALVPGMTYPNIDDERVNIPGTVCDSNWSYRYRPYLEDIIENEQLAQIMRSVIE